MKHDILTCLFQCTSSSIFPQVNCDIRRDKEEKSPHGFKEKDIIFITSLFIYEAGYRSVYLVCKWKDNSNNNDCKIINLLFPLNSILNSGFRVFTNFNENI